MTDTLKASRPLTDTIWTESIDPVDSSERRTADGADDGELFLERRRAGSVWFV